MIKENQKPSPDLLRGSSEKGGHGVLAVFCASVTAFGAVSSSLAGAGTSSSWKSGAARARNSNLDGSYWMGGEAPAGGWGYSGPGGGGGPDPRNVSRSWPRPIAAPNSRSPAVVAPITAALRPETVTAIPARFIFDHPAETHKRGKAFPGGGFLMAEIAAIA